MVARSTDRSSADRPHLRSRPRSCPHAGQFLGCGSNNPASNALEKTLLGTGSRSKPGFLPNVGGACRQKRLVSGARRNDCRAVLAAHWRSRWSGRLICGGRYPGALVDWPGTASTSDTRTASIEGRLPLKRKQRMARVGMLGGATTQVAESWRISIAARSAIRGTPTHCRTPRSSLARRRVLLRTSRGHPSAGVQAQKLRWSGARSRSRAALACGRSDLRIVRDYAS